MLVMLIHLWSCIAYAVVLPPRRQRPSSPFVHIQSTLTPPQQSIHEAPPPSEAESLHQRRSVLLLPRATSLLLPTALKRFIPFPLHPPPIDTPSPLAAPSPLPSLSTAAHGHRTAKPKSSLAAILSLLPSALERKLENPSKAAGVAHSAYSPASIGNSRFSFPSSRVPEPGKRRRRSLFRTRSWREDKRPAQYEGGWYSTCLCLSGEGEREESGERGAKREEVCEGVGVGGERGVRREWTFMSLVGREGWVEERGRAWRRWDLEVVRGER